MNFTWDPKKARTNLRKHAVSFEEAATALRDTLSVTGYYPDHSGNEDRFVTFGVSKKGRLLVVSHTEDGNIIHIISSRVAERGERTILWRRVTK